MTQEENLGKSPIHFEVDMNVQKHEIFIPMYPVVVKLF